MSRKSQYRAGGDQQRSQAPRGNDLPNFERGRKRGKLIVGSRALRERGGRGKKGNAREASRVSREDDILQSG